MERHLTTLGQELAACQDEFMRDRLKLPKARARLLSSMSRRPSAQRAFRTLAIAALLVGAGAVGFFLRGPLSAVQPGKVTNAWKSGEWILASSHATVPLQFADGTNLVLQPNGRARVTDVTPHGATVVVERGELRANVQPRSSSRWRVDVGPFHVTVVGTVFDVSWQPELERFSLVLRKGTVVVSGPAIAGERVVHAGEQLDVWVARAELQSSRVDESSKSGLLERPSLEQGEQRGKVPAAASNAVMTGLRAPEGVTTPIESNQTMDSLRALARSDRYRDALAEAERLGFDALCTSASAADVLLLGDVARLAGNVGRAQKAYLAARRRFIGNPAAQGAFMLGRIAQDHQGAYVEAATYFASYLREAPGGVFVREAASRLVESRVHAGDRAGAKSAAAQYLEAYPTGPYADKAREVLRGP